MTAAIGVRRSGGFPGTEKVTAMGRRGVRPGRLGFIAIAGPRGGKPESGAVSRFLACADRLGIAKKVPFKNRSILYLAGFSHRIFEGANGFDNQAGRVFQAAVT